MDEEDTEGDRSGRFCGSARACGRCSWFTGAGSKQSAADDGGDSDGCFWGSDRACDLGCCIQSAVVAEKKSEAKKRKDFFYFFCRRPTTGERGSAYLCAVLGE